MFDSTTQHSPLLGPYAERQTTPLTWLDRLAAGAWGWVAAKGHVRPAHWKSFLAEVLAYGRLLHTVPNAELSLRAGAMREGLRCQGFCDNLVAQSFALVREVAGRHVGLRHFDTQLIGGKILLDGMVAEMETGEGKTLTATLAACTAALAGFPVHVVTVNDYLAQRDAEWMGPIYRELGLRVGMIIEGMSPESRRAAYASDVTYCSNKELGFDYLKDRLVLQGQPNRVQLQLERFYGAEDRLGRLLLRGLVFGIIDEVDSVLVDEARTPLIISGGSSDVGVQQVYQTALSLSEKLLPSHDFYIETGEGTVGLTQAGKDKLAGFTRSLGGLWSGRQRREDFIQKALVAQHLLIRDKHYLVRDGKVQIIDEYTGRIAPDRSWERGLHQLLEAKEGCELSSLKEPLARISYQRFFKRYVKLAGMTGTAWEVASELWSVYGLKVVSLPPHRPVSRRPGCHQVYATGQAKWTAIVQRIAHIHQQGRPILVGTRSVEASEHLSQLLTQAGLSHCLLNARQDHEEARIVAQAGALGQITVATNMAGRGTDIRLSAAVVKLGGLHVIATERHDAARIDRQLFGRCGRQGDPGSFEAISSLEDDLITQHGRLWTWLGLMDSRSDQPLPSWLGTLVVVWAQFMAGQVHSRIRRRLLKMDEHLDSILAFSGRQV